MTYDVYRDVDGNPVVITSQQCAAIRHALSVYTSVVLNEVEKHTNPNPAFYVTDEVLSTVALSSKSRLLGRMLYEGLPPMENAPPVLMAEPRYDLSPEFVECGDIWDHFDDNMINVRNTCNQERNHLGTQHSERRNGIVAIWPKVPKGSV